MSLLCVTRTLTGSCTFYPSPGRQLLQGPSASNLNSFVDQLTNASLSRVNVINTTAIGAPSGAVSPVPVSSPSPSPEDEIGRAHV